MDEQAFGSHYDPTTSTLAVRGPLDRESLPRILEAVDVAFRRSALRLTVDLTRVAPVSAHMLGRLIHLCNVHYPGTLVVLPLREHERAIA